MKRDYTTGISEQVDLFIGTEAEHTPALGMPTLFVVGIQPLDRIWEICSDRKITHIYLGANQCFDLDHLVQYEKLATSLLDMGFWVTLDLDVRYYEGALDMLTNLSTKDQFIAMISVKLPCLTNLNYHASVKIDDKDFKASNPGVWVHQLHDLMARNKFTDWTKYGKDEIINAENKEKDPILDAPFVPLSSVKGIKSEEL